jgi:hypothetical protein
MGHENVKTIIWSLLYNYTTYHSACQTQQIGSGRRGTVETGLLMFRTRACIFQFRVSAADVSVCLLSISIASVVWCSEFLATDPGVSGSIPGASRSSGK